MPTPSPGATPLPQATALPPSAIPLTPGGVTPVSALPPGSIPPFPSGALPPGVPPPPGVGVSPPAGRGAVPAGATLLRPLPASPDLSGLTTFTTSAVSNLRADDFLLESRFPIDLKTRECRLILFYGENTESRYLSKVWAETAAQVPGGIFGAVNLIYEPRVAASFLQIGIDLNHPYYWVRFRQVPFILVYRGGWPQAFYNGQRAVSALVDYALTLACVPGYVEHQPLPASMQAENKLEITAVGPYSAVRSNSTQYVADQPVRQYNPAFPPVVQGSAEQQAEVAALTGRR